MQFLPQAQQQPEPEQEQEQEIITFTPSPTLTRLRTASALSLYSFWFLLGICAANLSRAISHGWILYWVLLLAASGWLMLGPSEETSEEKTATRRISGFALLLSITAFWDLLATIPFLPVHILQWIIPLWQCVGLGIVALILLVIVLALLS